MTAQSYVDAWNAGAYGNAYFFESMAGVLAGIAVITRSHAMG